MRLTRRTGGRYYRLRWTKPVNQFQAVFWTTIWLVWVLGSAKPDWTIMIPVGVCVVAIVAWANVLAVTAGVYEEDNGIIARRLFGTELYIWDELAGFEHVRRGTHDYVYVRLTDGTRHRLTNVLQGQRVIWEGGHTDDIVAVLSERLAAKQAHRIDS